MISLGSVMLRDEVVIDDLRLCLNVLGTPPTVTTDERNPMLTLIARMFLLSHNTPLPTEPTIHQRVSRQVQHTFGWPGQRYSDKDNSKKPRKNNVLVRK